MLTDSNEDQVDLDKSRIVSIHSEGQMPMVLKNKFSILFSLPISGMYRRILVIVYRSGFAGVFMNRKIMIKIILLN